MLFKPNFSGDVFVAFLRRLTGRFKRLFHLIIDSHPVHLSAQVRRWLAEHRDRVCAHFLPACSPELNPQELMNNDVKTNASGRLRPHNVKELIANVRTYVRRRTHSKTVIQSYFREKHVSYAGP